MTTQPLCKNPNHPKKGACLKVEPIRDRNAIALIKRNLLPHPRDFLLFTFGVNSGFRMSELLSLKVRHVQYGVPGHIIDLKQSKQDRYRAVMVNDVVFPAIARWLSVHPDPRPSAPVFLSRKTGDALTVSTGCAMVKRWCLQAGLTGHYGSHSLRKTWAYHMRMTYEQPIELIMKALGHSNPEETMRYVGLLPEEVIELYKMAV